MPRLCPARLLQLCWRPSLGAMPSFGVVTGAGALLAGAPADSALASLAPVPVGGIACAAWSASGRQLALGRGDEVVVCGPDGGEKFSVQVASQEAQDEEQYIQASGKVVGREVVRDKNLTIALVLSAQKFYWFFLTDVKLGSG
jgi:hypothetical protein